MNMKQHQPMLPHTTLDHCWVCKNKFDGANYIAHSHHIVPRAFGGADGPQVSVCTTHHSALHEVAKRLFFKKPYTEFLTGDLEQNKRLMYLATICVNSKLATDNDPNKAQVIVLHLKRTSKDKLASLRKIYPTARSNQALIELAIHALYTRHFIPKK